MTTPMSTALILPDAGAGEIARKEVQSRLAGIGNLGGKNIDPAQKEKKLRESCEGFESIFIQKMWEEMRKTLPKSTLLHGKEEQFWQGMYDQELAKKMTSAGGIGLADMMYAQLSRGLTSASRATATDASAIQRPFTPEAAPMLPPTPDADSPHSESGRDAAKGKSGTSSAAASVYGGVAPMQDAGHAENGSAAARTLTGAQAVAGGQDPEEAARLAEQAMQASAQPERHRVVRTTNVVGNMNSGLNLARKAQFEAGSKLGPNAVRPPMQQMLGLAQPQSRAAQADGQNWDQGGMQMDMSGMSIPPLTGNVLDAQSLNSPGGMQAAMHQQAMQGQVMQGQNMQPGSNAPVGQAAPPQPQKVRYTTNIPPTGRGGKQGLIRTLNVDGAGPNSNAGAGIAAYHAQQAQGAGMQQQAPAQGAQPAAQVSTLPMGPAGQPAVLAASQPASPGVQAPNQPVNPGVAPVASPASAQGVTSPVPLTGGQIFVRQGGQGAAASGIPPLTATDVYGRP
ncbi:MAG TPA: rod-binding protein [Desulfovibrio sp.]|uniref:rod-binding protein n=1 Tax=Desulfovibrio sp. TaxID=885 RepID=UPI002D2E2E86|nr:rod-binding protein [Desulfovibrio sp.]HZF60223.1 rod-binding protein [Desulfovibrio sp.]